MEVAKGLRKGGFGKDKKDLPTFNDGEKEKADREKLKIRERGGCGEKQRTGLLKGWEGLVFDSKVLPPPSYWKSRKATSLSKPQSDLNVTS